MSNTNTLTAEGTGVRTGRPVLEAHNIVKTYELGDVTVRALRGIDLSIYEGEMLAIMGPSGSGKSTLMHIIGLLDNPTSGSVTVEGEEVSEMTPNGLATVRNKRIGFVFQAFNLLAKTTALANVELPLVYAGVSASERSSRAKAALERVGLGDRLGHYSNQLSGGQQQRVAVARALVTNPSIVLADEPTGNLDSRSGVEVMMMLQELNAQGITVVVVTHSDDIAQHATRVLHVKDGCVVREEVVDPSSRVFAKDELAELDAEEATRAAEETSQEGGCE